MAKIVKNFVYLIFTYIVLSLLFNNIGQIAIAALQKETSVASLPMPTGCTYDDGGDPLDPDQCLLMTNNGNTGGFDNVFFTLVSPQSFDEYTCILLNSLGQPVSDSPSTNCKANSNLAQQSYTDLPNGQYTFNVVATKKAVVSGSVNTLIGDVTVESPLFEFFVGTSNNDATDGGVSDTFGGESDFPEEIALSDAQTVGATNTRLNPIWSSCEATSGGARDAGSAPINTAGGGSGEPEGRPLSAMKYEVFGEFSFNDLVRELKKFDREEFVLEVYVNFLSGILRADVTPTIKSIDRIPSIADLYKLDPLLGTSVESPRDKKDVPNLIPVLVESINTDCVYEAPVIGTSFNRGGPSAFVSETVFKNSNPPFATCQANSAGAVYQMTFEIDDSDRRTFENGKSQVRFVIEQQLTGQNPEYYASLSFDPFQNNEKRIGLTLLDNGIVTQCKDFVLY